ncbi:phospholipase D/Transphosphatidylase [Methanococcus vannielii SB]|uniref:Phospholipase D/Transphosphatidylase n=1 Tax=Methanococcus vannielii (strain ATCC 35089 / DSM 1224 / JCM 13029 / OCM 148 / SB) TaxID=406327 RepID=A6UPB3_METVS|nr:phospholipase D-like domain-containing protein [Methanococcus vannielii]ABR54335.1 phospholipase D/Transphosphatidylase [Methanococcus vannielii SB]
MEFLSNIYPYIAILNFLMLSMLFILFIKYSSLLRNSFKYSYSKVCPDDRIEVLNDEKYYYYILNKIKSAKREINIIMFSIYKSEKTAELINELIEARNRGVMVRVILEEDVGSNILAQSRLSSKKVLVKFHDSKKTHNKFIIIDDTVIVGSHNWTDKALFQNKESSIALINKVVLEEEKRYFELLWGASE